MNKTALVTGASQGLGEFIAVRLAKDGFNIAINCLNEEVVQKDGHRVAELCRAFGVDADCFACDVSDFEASEQMVKAVNQKFGSLDVLVNNAGITADGLIVRMKEEQFDRVIKVNLKGTFNMIHAATAVMMRQRSGRIINVSSVAGLYGNASQINYSASKAGVVGMTLTAAKELGARNITVNAVAPGFIETQMTAVLPDKVKQGAIASIPLGRFGKPEDVAGAVAFLASDDAAYISGQVIVIDGAMSM